MENDGAASTQQECPSFRYSFEDFTDATAVVAKQSAKILATRASSTENARRLRVRQIIGMIVFGACMLLLMIFHQSLPRFVQPHEGEWYVLRLIGPVILFFVWMYSLNALTNRAMYRGAWRSLRDRQQAKGLVNMALAAGIPMLLLFAKALLDALIEHTGEELAHELFLWIAPWLIIFAATYSLAVIPQKRGQGVIHSKWEKSAHLRLEKRLRIYAIGFELRDELTRHELHWEALTCEEGELVFALMLGEVFYMIPKRVLSEEQIVFMRMRYGITEPVIRTGGFPVIAKQASSENVG